MADLIGITDLPGATVVEPPLSGAEAELFEKEVARHRQQLHKMYKTALKKRGIALLSTGFDKDGNQFYLGKWNEVKYIFILPEGD